MKSYNIESTKEGGSIRFGISNTNPSEISVQLTEVTLSKKEILKKVENKLKNVDFATINVKYNNSRIFDYNTLIEAINNES